MSALVSIEEARRALGVSRSTVWRMIQRGALPSVRRGGRRLVRSASLKRVQRLVSSIPALTNDHPITN